MYKIINIIKKNCQKRMKKSPLFARYSIYYKYRYAHRVHFSSIWCWMHQEYSNCHAFD